MTDIISLAIDFFKHVLSPFIKLVNWIYNQLPFKVVRRRPIPKLGIIESSWRGQQWEYAKQGDREIVVVHTYWQITNTLPYNITAMNVFLTKPQRVKGTILTKDTKSQYWGSYPIPRGYTTEMDASFVLDKKWVKSSEDIIKVNIEIQDAIERAHKINGVLIRPIKKVVNKDNALIVENPSSLKSHLERQVVAVLKNEVQQYKIRGRREGRLGTVDWPRGTLEWRKTDDKIQFLFESSNRQNVTSEHVNALLNLYNTASQKGKREIITALLNRLDKRKEYRDIGYLIIFFLFEIDNLEEGLKVALRKLKGDKANAFSDMLRMLDFLLAFRYMEFSELEVDAVEAFIYSTKEHPFQIKERINAIRVRKMFDSSNKVSSKEEIANLKIDTAR